MFVLICLFLSTCLPPISPSFWKIHPESSFNLGAEPVDCTYQVQVIEAHHTLGLKGAGCQISA